MSENSQSSYRSIFKATSLFGGVQVYQIFVQIIKSKFIAVLLGPAGIGIIGLYQSSLLLIQNITNMGLTASGVRDVSEANSSGNHIRISKIVTVVRRLVWITGIFGALTVVALSPILSKTAFGNYDYTIPFVLLSITLLIDQISAGQKIVLQGLRRLKDLAKASAIGQTLGLVVSIPFYYWIGVKGIVPTLIMTSVCSLIISWWYSRKVTISKVQITTKQTFEQGRMMLVMGISMSLSGIFSTAAAYGIRGFIQGIDGIEEVGLFQAGFVIINTYVGLITNAIATDYYPRLAAINKDNVKCRDAVNKQGEIATMIMAPMLAICLVFMPYVLQLLYSDQFLRANEYITWACLGMILRLASWVISFLFVAKAESKLFIINELSACIYYVVFSIGGYLLWGLKGLGIAFTLTYSVYFIQVYLIARLRYNFKFSYNFVLCYGIQLILICVCLIIVSTFVNWYKYIFGTIVIIVSILHGITGLNKRMNLKDIIKNRLIKK